MSDVASSRVTTAFLLAYTIMNGVSGPLIDRLGTRLGYGLCVLWWSLSAMLHAFSRGAFSLGAFRFLLGIGEAGNWPGAVKVVAEWFPEKERAIAWIPFLVAGFGNILGGWMSSALLKRSVSVTVARKASVTVFAALMLSAIPAVLATEAWLAVAFVSIAMLGYTGALANMLTIPSDVFPKNAVASVYGLASMGSGFGGMLFPLITGEVVERWSYTPAFIGFGFLPLVCASILWLFAGSLDRKLT